MKYFISFLQLCLFFCSCNVIAKKCGGKGQGGVIGGTKATRGQFPWQIYIYNGEGPFLCGGSIISPRHVLTAGHCIMNKANNAKADLSKLEIFAGSLNTDQLYTKDGQKAAVKAIHNDNRWKPGQAPYELTILTLSSNFTWTEAVKPIRYANSDDPTNLDGQFLLHFPVYPLDYDPISFLIQEVIASGWGNIDHYGEEGKGSKDLLWAKMIVSKCEKKDYAYDDIFCARGANGESVCSGDSGGPIVCKDTAGKDYLCGFSSMSYCEKGQSMLARVNYYNEFIKKAMSKP